MLRYLLGASAFALVAAIASRGGVFAANIILARHFSQEMYGLVSFAYLTALSLGNFVSAGLGQTGAKIAGQYESKNDETLRIAIAEFAKIGMLVAMAVALLIAFSGKFIDVNVSGHDYSLAVKLAACILFFTAGAATCQGLLLSLNYHRNSSAYSVAASLLMLGAVACTVHYLNPFISLIALGVGALVQFSLGGVTVWCHIRKVRPFAPQRESVVVEVRRNIIRFLTPAMLVALMGAPVHWLCITLLARSSDGVSQVALFNVAFQWYLMVCFVPSVIGNMSISLFSKYSLESSKKELSSLLITTISVVSLLSLLVGGPVIFFSDVAAAVYGERYSAAAEVIEIIAVAGMVASISLCLQHFMASQDRVWRNFLFATGYSLVYLMATLMAINYSMGAYGVALAILVSAVSLLFLQVIFLWVGGVFHSRAGEWS